MLGKDFTMKNKKTRVLSFLLALLLGFGTVLPVLAIEGAGAQNKKALGAAASGTVDYDSLYVQDADGDGKTDVRLLWDAFDKTRFSKISSETDFAVDSAANYGSGYLFNNSKEFVLTNYLPSFTYGTQTAQKDYTVELVLSMHAPFETTSKLDCYMMYKCMKAVYND